MTKQLREFIEWVTKDEAVKAELDSALNYALIKFAKEKGCSLKPEDFGVEDENLKSEDIEGINAAGLGFYNYPIGASKCFPIDGPGGVRPTFDGLGCFPIDGPGGIRPTFDGSGCFPIDGPGGVRPTFDGLDGDQIIAGGLK